MGSLEETLLIDKALSWARMPISRIEGYNKLILEKELRFTVRSTDYLTSVIFSELL